jgi:putative aldouronate transport system substrate-binding protein
MSRKMTAILITVLIVVLTACSGNSGKSGNEAAPTKETPAQAVNESGETDYALGAYDETVTLHTVQAEFSSAIFPSGDDMTKNAWTRTFKERLNVEVVTDWVTDDYGTKLNLAISSNELPDVFSVNPSQLQQLIDANMIMDLTEVYETYASDRVKGYMDVDKLSFESGKKDGKLYGVPQLHYGFVEQPDFIWIRNDWKEKLGLADPKTMDDIKNIALKFKEAYGGYGLAAEQSLEHLNLLAIGWGAHPGMWIKGDDGRIEYGSVQPEMKDALAAYAEWFKLGIIDPEFPIKDVSAMNSGIVSGKSGLQPYYQWWGYSPGMDTVANLGPEAIFYPYLIPTVDGKVATQSLNFANGSYMVVNKKAKNPEAAMKLLNLYAQITDEATKQESAELLENGIAHVAGAFKIINPMTDYEQYERVSEAIRTKDTSNLTTSIMWLKYNESVEFAEKGTSSTVGGYLQQGAPKSAYGLAKQILDNNQYVQTAMWGASPKELVKYGSTLNDILVEGFTKIIMGAEDVDYFDKLVQNWHLAGGEEATEAVNVMYGQ